MLLLCPACRTPLPEATDGRITVLTCTHCSAEVDVSRAGTAAGRPRFVPERDRTGDEVGGYRLGERIGAGGMGTVYRAQKGEAPGGVAVKFLSPALAGEPDLVARFAREVKLLRALDHDAIVRVLDHGDDGGAPWYAMQLAAGPDLRTRLASGPLPPAELAAVFARILAALDHAHARGVVHRDLKPGNVLLAPSGAKLADFGIARFDADVAAGATRLTETAAIVGTFPYMSPEQRAGGELDRRSDLFSVGVMLYETATGRLPQGAFPPASQVNRAFGAPFDRVVTRLLDPDPAARFATASEAARALAAAFRPRRHVVGFVAAGAASVIAVVLTLLPPALTKLDTGGSKSGDNNGNKSAAGEVALPPEKRPSQANVNAPAPAPQTQAPMQMQGQGPMQIQALDPPVPVQVQSKSRTSLGDRLKNAGRNIGKNAGKMMKSPPQAEDTGGRKKGAPGKPVRAGRGGKAGDKNADTFADPFKVEQQRQAK